MMPDNLLICWLFLFLFWLCNGTFVILLTPIAAICFVVVTLFKFFDKKNRTWKKYKKYECFVTMVKILLYYVFFNIGVVVMEVLAGIFIIVYICFMWPLI